MRLKSVNLDYNRNELIEWFYKTPGMGEVLKSGVFNISFRVRRIRRSIIIKPFHYS